MKFYGVGAVWGGEDNKILCRFIDGELETDDEKVIKKLLGNGYKNDGGFPTKLVQPIDYKPEIPIIVEPTWIDVEEVLAQDYATKKESLSVETPIVIDGEKVTESVVKQAEKKPVGTSAKTAQVKKVVKK